MLHPHPSSPICKICARTAFIRWSNTTSGCNAPLDSVRSTFEYSTITHLIHQTLLTVAGQNGSCHWIRSIDSCSADIHARECATWTKSTEQVAKFDCEARKYRSLGHGKKWAADARATEIYAWRPAGASRVHEFHLFNCGSNGQPQTRIVGSHFVY